jgi:bifunctional non-homologous end joining protein LigD
VLQALRQVRGSFILDGEICLLDDRGRPNFEGMRARTARRRAGQPVTYFAFDLLFLNGRDVRGWPLNKRKERLRKLLPKKPALVFVDYIEAHGETLYQHAIANGMEGIVAKRADSPYVGERSMDWRKAKPKGYHNGWERPLTRQT